MLVKRIIPCLDIKDGKVVKGTNFVNLRDAGDPVVLARKYAQDRADELVFLDIQATLDNRKTLVDLVERVARELDIPFTVGGGIKSVAIANEILRAGADKISVNSAAFIRPQLIQELSAKFGSQCVVVAIDAKEIDGQWIVHTSGGKVAQDKLLVDWAKQAETLGAGEILFTAMNADGTKNGFAMDALSELSEALKVPIIASGGAGTSDHFVDLFKNSGADAALAASVFHFKQIAIPTLKKELAKKQIPVRL